MPKNVVSVRFTLGNNPYVSDAGLDYSLATTFTAPPYLSEANINAIVAASGGVRSTEPSICSDGNSFKPRKLEFIMAQGNTMSITIAQRIDWTLAAIAIRNTINSAAAANNQVVCIKLAGEKFNNLNDELGVNFDGTTFAASHAAPATSDKQNYVNGVYTYSADVAANFGDSQVHPIRSITEATDNTFAAQLGSTPATCIGSLLNIQSCGNGRRNPRKHRRYLLSFAVNPQPSGVGPELPEKEDIQLPVAGSAASEILSCGQAAAALPGLFCIGYMGESYSRVHRFLS